jgi:hypothetical protein
MLKGFTLGSWVINLIYSGQQLFSYTLSMTIRDMEIDKDEIQIWSSDN